MAPPLACTVRECGLFLERQGRTFACVRGHSYDVARAGYVTLLQPQDRKSREAGDRREAIEARARLLAAGVGRTVLERVVEHAGTAELGRRRDRIERERGAGERTGAERAHVEPVE